MASRYMGPRGDDIIVGSGDIPGLGITADPPRVGGDRMFIGEGAPRSVNVPNIQPIVPPTIASAPSFKKDIFPTRREPTMDPLSGLTPEIVEALNLRKEATDAATAATDQYEADVADYKNTMATEAEQGIASLPEVDFKKDIFPTRPTGTEPPSMMGITMDPVPDPVTGDRYPGTVPAENPYANVFETPPTLLELGDPYIDISEPYFGEPKPTAYIPESDVITAGTPPMSPTSVDPGNSTISLPSLPWDPDNLPWEPPLPPVDPPPLPPVDPGPTGPINPYTGQPIENAYQRPTSFESGATPLVRAMSPQEFGTAPGFDLKPPKQPRPIRRPIYIDDQTPPNKKDPMAPPGAKHGMYLSDSFLNKGLSQLPTGKQNDTLTTQVFQAGFRPRR